MNEMTRTIAADRTVHIDAGRIHRAKKAYCTRHVAVDDAACLITGDIAPQPGDLVLARVDRLGHHQKLELEDGRRAQMHEGEEIVVCFGNRYAPDQFEGLVGPDLSPCHLVAAGGVAATVKAANGRVRRATEITPLGLLADSRGKPLNLRDHTLPAIYPVAGVMPVIAVAGTSMNAGKTYTAAQLIRGLEQAGYRVGAAKITGTGAGGDRWQMQDAGATTVLDFTDLGHVSTYMLDPGTVETIYATLIGHLAQEHDVAVIEIADGLLQKETKALLGSPRFAATIDALVFCAADSMGAIAGARMLTAQNLPLAAVSGLLTRAPLAVKEVRGWIETPVIGSAALGTPEGGAAVWGHLLDAPVTRQPAIANEPVAARLADIEERIVG